jgi:hypothetical protein
LQGFAGLTHTEATRRLAQHGPNVIATSSIPPWYRVLWSALGHPFNCILVFLAATAYLTEDVAVGAAGLGLAHAGTPPSFVPGAGSVPCPV